MRSHPPTGMKLPLGWLRRNELLEEGQTAEEVGNSRAKIELTCGYEQHWIAFGDADDGKTEDQTDHCS